MESMWPKEVVLPIPAKIALPIDSDHEIIRLTKALPWQEMIGVAMDRRAVTRSTLSGPTPRYRALVGALTLMAIKNLNFREAQDQVANYAPARYLCDLLDSAWTPDHTTIFQFAKMLGADGMKDINDLILKVAAKKKLSDPTRLMSDTTAQEARVPYPNEAGLMNRFMTLVGRGVRRLRGKFETIKREVSDAVEKTKGLLRNAHLFAKGREQKRKIEKKMYHTVREIHETINAVLASGANVSGKAAQEIVRLNGVMTTLLPQIKHFLTTGFVAAKKIIHLQIPEIYAIVRGKAGKSTEFGLKWGINRIGGGFLSGFLLGDGDHCADTAFCLESLKQHQAFYGKAPRVFGFDRGGDSVRNIRRAKTMRVKHVGIAPRGKTPWSVSPCMQDRIRRERAQVEGSIGSIKSSRYGFTKPHAHSKAALVACGHRAIFGFNARKLITMEAELAVT